MEEEIKENNSEEKDMSIWWSIGLIIIIISVFIIFFYFNNIEEENRSKVCERCFGDDWSTRSDMISRGVYQYTCINNITNKTKIGSVSCYDLGE